MRPTIEKYLPTFDQIKEIKKRLKECKSEWLEKNVTGQDVLGHNTIRQIIENAVEGATYWDFDIEMQWKEEVHKYDKKNNIWSFDGYVYHAKGILFIAGIGSRTQFGCKVAIGGKDNQNSAYKAATSDAFKKAASLFGIGEEIYSKIKIESDDQHYNEIQGDPNYYVGNPNLGGYPPAAVQPQTNYPYPPAPMQAGHADPSQQVQYIQPAYQAPWGQAAPAPNQSGWVAPAQEAPTEDPYAYPFNSFNEGTPEHAEYIRRNPQAAGPVEQPGAQPQGYSAQPAAPTQQQPFAPSENPQPQYGAPAPAQPSAVPGGWDQAEIQRSHAHRNRLKIADQNGLNPYVRDFLRDPNATIDSITQETLKPFNDFLEKYSA